MSSFSKTRWNWTMKVQKKYATPLFYKKIWPDSEVIATDQMVGKSKLWKKRDFDGLDKIIFHPQGNEHHIAQRFRSSDSGNDFSLRYKVPNKRGGTQKSEYFKLKKAYDENYWLPDLYAFGNTTFGKKRNKKGEIFVPEVENPFEDFYIFKVRPLIKLISEKKIPKHPKNGGYPNKDPKTGKKDGSYGVYFKVSDFPENVKYFENSKSEKKLEDWT